MLELVAGGAELDGADDGQTGRPQLVLGVADGTADVLGGATDVLVGGGAEELVGAAEVLGGVLDTVGVGVELKLLGGGAEYCGWPICWVVGSGCTGLPLR